jgi:ricin-type beta-trefoil lectin protein/putative Ig domain-containing protein
MTMSGNSRARLSRILASALLGVGLAATCAAASPGSSAAGRTAVASTAVTSAVGSPAKLAAKVVAATAAASGVTLTNPGDQVAKVLPETVSLQLSAQDSAGGALSYTATGLPPGVTINPATGLISGTVTAYYDGTASVTATDTSGASATVSFNWLAENAISLAPEPTLQNAPDSVVIFQLHAADPEPGEAVSYAVTGLPPGLSVDPTTGRISGTTTATISSSDVSVTVSDSTGSSVSTSFIWRVWNKITVSPPAGEQTIQAGTPVSVPVSATDSAAGQTFTFSATGFPPGLSIDPTSGVITGSATAEGQFKATITATDSTGSQGSTTDYWFATGQAEITSPGNVVSTAGQLAQIPLTAGDTASNAVLDYSIAGGPPGAYVNWNSATSDGWRTATLTGWPAPAGSYKTTISAIDPDTSTASVTFTWTVKPVAGTGPTGPVRLGEEGKCLDDTGNSSANGNKVQIWSCNGDAAQNWTYAEDGTLRIHGKCLDDTGYGTKLGTKLQLWSCLNHTNQMWTAVNTVNLYNALARDCLSVPNAGNGVQVELGYCEWDPQAEWTLPAGEILSGVPGECITDSGGGTANGTKIVLGTCADSSAQRWTFDPDGTIRIFGKCLSLATPASGSDAILWSCGAGHMQQWTLDGAGVALGTAIGADSNIPGNDTALESPPGQTAAGTQIVLGPFGGSNADWDIW